jgi:hypothetical protein
VSCIAPFWCGGKHGKTKNKFQQFLMGIMKPCNMNNIKVSIPHFSSNLVLPWKFYVTCNEVLSTTFQNHKQA